MADPILDDLTEAQREAASHINGPMLVVAGAGSGKTRVVTRRIAHLIREGVKPWNILAMTFTNKAAGEMRERVAQLTGQAPRWIGTFHSLCARLLRRDIEKLGKDGRDGRFTIYDATDQNGLVKEILKSLKLDDKKFKPRKVLSRISRAKCDLIPPRDYGDGSWDDDQIRNAYKQYEKRLRKLNAVDFDDLLLLTVRLLQGVPGLKEVYHEQFPYLLIDEYQDTNRTQYMLMRLLTGEAENVHVTGDPDQSIYSWRGADYRNIMDFQKDFPNARVVRLERNYRSTQEILDIANHLIKKNTHRIEKSLYTEISGGALPRVVTLESDRDEADWIAQQIQSRANEGQSLARMAIFYRTNAQSRTFEEAFMRHGLPYQIVGGLRFYERKEVKDLLAHMKLLVNPRDIIALRRILNARPTGVGPKTLDKVLTQAEVCEEPVFRFLASPDFANVYEGRANARLKDFARWCNRLASIPMAPVGAAVSEIMRVSGLVEHLYTKEEETEAESRIENMEMLLNRAAEFEEAHPEGDLPAFLEDVALVADIDQWDRSEEAVSLMTLHSAKGLEFPVVYVVGVEGNLLPHQSAEGAEATEEERRLFYVGITRAEQDLTITHAVKRMMWGRLDYAIASPFLRELPEQGIDRVTMASSVGSGWTDDGWDDLDEDFDLDPPSATPTRPTRSPKKSSGALFEKNTFANHDSLDVFDGIDVDPGLATEEALVNPTRMRKHGFRIGDLVNHPTFGKGKILSVSKSQALVQFFIGGSKLLHLGSAKLSKA